MRDLDTYYLSLLALASHLSLIGGPSAGSAETLSEQGGQGYSYCLPETVNQDSASVGLL
jgi:hypothetical protein